MYVSHFRVYEFDHMSVELFIYLPNERELNANGSDEHEFIDKFLLGTHLMHRQLKIHLTQMMHAQVRICN